MMDLITVMYWTFMTLPGLSLPFWPIFIPSVISFSVRLMFIKWIWPTKNPCDGLMFLLVICFQVFKSMMVIMMILKYEMLSWQWEAVLWPYWTAFAIIIVVTLFAATLTGNLVIGYFSMDSSCSPSKSLTFSFRSTMGYFINNTLRSKLIVHCSWSY